MGEVELEEAQEVDNPRPSEKEEDYADVESQIKSAMLSRVSHFKDQADSLTLVSVRRLLEKDLGLETNALDAHKKFIKQCLAESLEHIDDDNDPKSSLDTEDKIVSVEKEKIGDSAKRKQPKKDVKEASSEDGKELDDSPVMGLLTGKNKAKAQNEDSEGMEKEELPSESTVKDAVWKRASYLKANSNTLTMAGVRKLLEGDLGFEQDTLLPFKKFISKQIDLVLSSPEVSKPASSVKKKNSEKSSRGKPVKNDSSEESGDSLDSQSDEEEAKPKKKVVARRKVSDEPKKRKVSTTESKGSNKKKLKVLEESSDKEAGGVSEDDQSQSSDEKSAKKKEVAAPSYGKRVERLKSVIKSCGMSIPPVVYKKAKQVSEDKREAFVRKELEEILSREGLSADPSEKEIKDVKKRKERAKELEGIDMSNIVSSTRRRSTASFIPPPKPEVTVETKKDDTENNSSDEEGESEEGDSEDDSDEGNGSQSEEEVNEDLDDDISD